MKSSTVKPVRCAIYTRVSTDHGLEQDFNSLDAQHDAAQAYIRSQKLVTRISVLSTLLGGGQTTERLFVRISIETHKTSPDFDQAAADNAKNRIKQALGEIGCDVFIETDR